MTFAWLGHGWMFIRLSTKSEVAEVFSPLLPARSKGTAVFFNEIVGSAGTKTFDYLQVDRVTAWFGFGSKVMATKSHSEWTIGLLPKATTQWDSFVPPYSAHEHSQITKIPGCDSPLKSYIYSVIIFWQCEAIYFYSCDWLCIIVKNSFFWLIL